MRTNTQLFFAITLGLIFQGCISGASLETNKKSGSPPDRASSIEGGASTGILPPPTVPVDRTTASTPPTCNNGYVYSEKLNSCRLLITGPVVPSHVEPLAENPYEAVTPNSATDNIIYHTENSTQVNHDRTINDARISRDELQITTSTALAGSITSIRYKNAEIITSGGHGAAAQMALHDWSNGTRDFSQGGKIVTIKDRPNECNNPTEAGNRTNDVGYNFPWNGPSSSYLKYMGTFISSGFPGIYSQNSPVDYTPPNSWSEDSGYGHCYNTKGWFRDYVLEKKIVLGYKNLRNVAKIEYDITIGENSDHFDATFVMYLTRYFSREYRYDVEKNLTVYKPRAFALSTPGKAGANLCFDNTAQAPLFPIFSDPTLGLSVALVPIKSASPGVTHIQGYTATNHDFYAPNYLYKFRNISQQLVAQNVWKGQKLNFTMYLFVGGLDEVKANIRSFYSQEDCTNGIANRTAGSALDPRIFNWQEYIELNQDLPSEYRNSSAATSHWLRYGLREGRRGSKSFWSPSYLAKNPELLQGDTVKTDEKIDHCKASRHYLIEGINRGLEK